MRKERDRKCGWIGDEVVVFWHYEAHVLHNLSRLQIARPTRLLGGPLKRRGLTRSSDCVESTACAVSVRFGVCSMR